MADSIIDVVVPQDDWVELFTATGILAGSALIIQNKGSTDVIAWIGTAKPVDDFTGGFMLLSYTSKDSIAHEVVAGNNSVWVKATSSGQVGGRLSVQDLNGILPVTQVENATLTKLLTAIDETDPTQNKLKTTAQLVDNSGRSAMISMTGELHVAGKIDDVNVNFQYGVRTANVNALTTGTGTQGQDKSTATISSGTGIGSSTLFSKEPVRYRSGHESHCAMSCVFATPEANVNQYSGFLNALDKFAVGFQGLDFGLWFVEGGNVNFTTQANFNYDKLDGTGPSGFILDPQMGNLYRLTFTWHGFLPLMLEIADGLGWHRVHIFNFVNTVTETHLENPHIPVGVLIERTSGTGADLTLKTGSWRAGSIALADDDESSDYWTAHTVLDSPLINGRNNIFTIRNKTSYFGKTNHIVYELGVVTFDSTANKTVAVYGVTNATLVGSSPFVDIDTVNSPLQVSEGGTLTGGSQGPATIIKSGGDRRTDVRGTGIKIYPGEDFTFEVTPGGPVNGDFSISARLVGRH